VSESSAGPSCFVCRCEELTAADIAAAIEAGARTVNDVKRRTRAGMGLCQGVYCLHHVARTIAEQLGTPPEAVFPMTVRPPVRAITLSTLAALGEDA
jgi:NAD(P)H-nitrite reductase large subunit